ncbi:MAG TPA: hypothetical protein VFK48_01800 [Usitatibacter sp.]|nr:hypothetical protein [Usitatibacter sp.]
MKRSEPKGLWEEIRSAFSQWLDGDPSDAEEEASDDPSMMFHLLFTMPLIIGILVTVRRLA